jgi:hypothetical protein
MIQEMMDRLRNTDDVEAVYYMGGLDMLLSMWLDGGVAADMAAEKFRAECDNWLEEWVEERESR